MASRKKQVAPKPQAALEGYSYPELKPLVRLALDAKVSVLVRGHPGIGKSTLARDLAGEMQLPLVDVRLAQRDPAEVAGVFVPDRERQTLELFAPDWVRDACDRPTFVLLDEINAAVTKLHQAAAYQIVLEHRVGPFAFHPDTVVMAAGNLEEDRAIVTPLSSALTNRFAHFVMRPDVDTWVRWASGAGLDARIIAFVASEGVEVLYQPSVDYAFPTPRSWEMASRMLARALDEDFKRVTAACVGRAMADRFAKWQAIYRKIPAADVITKGKAMDFTAGAASEPSFIYAAVFCIGSFLGEHGVIDAHLPNVQRFLRSPGLDPEFQLLLLRQLTAKAPETLRRMRALPDFRLLAGELVGFKFAEDL
jgi:MoxR-like ATPase